MRLLYFDVHRDTTKRSIVKMLILKLAIQKNVKLKAQEARMEEKGGKAEMQEREDDQVNTINSNKQSYHFLDPLNPIWNCTK